MKLQEDLVRQPSCGKEVIRSLLGLLVTLLLGFDVGQEVCLCSCLFVLVLTLNSTRSPVPADKTQGSDCEDNKTRDHRSKFCIFAGVKKTSGVARIRVWMFSCF